MVYMKLYFRHYGDTYQYIYSTRTVNLYMISDRIGYTHDRIG